MAIATTCPNCKALFRLAEELAGKKVQCQKCQCLFVVPRSDDLMTSPGMPAPAVEKPSAPPEPQTEATVPLPAPPPAAPPTAPAPSADFDTDNDSKPRKPPPVSKDRDDDRPRRRRPLAEPASGGGSMFPFVLVAGGLLALACLACMGVGGLWMFIDKTPPAKKKVEPIVKKDVPPKFDGIPPKLDPPKFDGAPKFDGMVDKKKNNNIPKGGENVAVLDGTGFYRSDNVLFFNDPPTIANRPHKLYVAKLEAGKTYRIDMMSDQFDSYLYLFDDANVLLMQDDDSGGFPNARIQFMPNRTANYRIHASRFGGQGDFTLTIQQIAP